MNSDGPIVDEVRRRREEISARFGDDLDRYFEHVRQLQEQHRDRLVNQITVVRGGEMGQATSREK